MAGLGLGEAGATLGPATSRVGRTKKTAVVMSVRQRAATGPPSTMGTSSLQHWRSGLEVWHVHDKATWHLREVIKISRISKVACSPQTKHSCAQERPNTDSDGQEGNNRHQDEHDQDSAVHQMVVPLGLAVPQLIPRLLVIIHKVIIITSCYAI